MKQKSHRGNFLEQAKIMTEEDVKRTYLRFAYQFLEPYEDPAHPAIIGMQTRGVYMGRRIMQIIKNETGAKPDFGVLDVTFYRDDFRSKLKMPEVKVTEIPFDLYNRDVILVDDVLYTGRTVRSAMDALMAYGRPRSIRFCCMIDRGHRELPVSADYVGLTVPTHEDEEVRVKVNELDGEDAVFVVKGGADE
ncbi:bifunctional pyr operon transcriptional regulator/uracil phosphoribosyltransferase PyrR [Rhodohalobacter sp.]|uniref:bifunctional pyr operon transcriptional regulator/uracil phosphoribosyltransferase PyrR n=1 Tax=Rhodohalobacter sp. TaxID=1974210 RepID=UPI002ACD98B6|nr:bifunctional pyr operon transcriptional regulator/uracil phosphoribosyltransferase PyrR [Rhodohalobacter sp.]